MAVFIVFITLSLDCSGCFRNSTVGIMLLFPQYAVVCIITVFCFCVAGMPLSLECKAFFGYSGENRRPIIYWMKGEKFVEELAGHIKESEVR